MRRRTWMYQLLTFSSVGLLARTAHADVEKASKEVTEKTTGIVQMITQCFEGGAVGAEAQQQLIEKAGDITLAIAILFVAYIVATWVGRKIGALVTSRVDVTLGKFLAKAVRNMILLVVAMVAMEKYFGFQVAGLAAMLAAASFAVGMALQGTLGNFAAGVMLLMFRPFKVDDYIVVADTEGVVEEIDLFTTRINTLDNRHVIVPNAEIFGAKLENYSRNQVRRVDVNVGAGYSADTEDTRAALTKAVNKVAAEFQEDGRIDAPTPQVYLMELGASSVDWQLRVWCHPRDYWAVRESMTAEAKRQLDAANISIPFPQMDVHVVGKVMAKAA